MKTKDNIRNVKALVPVEKKIKSKKELALKNPPMNRPSKNRHDAL